jgi:hypothetical protein
MPLITDVGGAVRVGRERVETDVDQNGVALLPSAVIAMVPDRRRQRDGGSPHLSDQVRATPEPAHGLLGHGLERVVELHEFAIANQSPFADMFRLER